MKKRLNLITLLIAFAFGLHTASFFMEEFGDHKDSFMRGYEEGATGKRGDELYYLTLIPKDFSVMTDSVYNEKTAQWLPSRTMQTVVSAPAEEMSLLRMLWVFLFAVGAVAAFIVIVVSFIKLIMAVNRSVIFEWINVSRLRRIGIGFIFLFIINLIIDLFYHQLAVAALQIPDYVISNSTVFSASTLILGLVTLLIAEIFSVGLRLKEEQDLTI